MAGPTARCPSCPCTLLTGPGACCGRGVPCPQEPLPKCVLALAAQPPPFLLEGAQSLPGRQASSGETGIFGGPRQHGALPLTWRGGLPLYLGTHLAEHRDWDTPCDMVPLP